jgi:nucleoside-diphosphate-sugar epimerase
MWQINVAGTARVMEAIAECNRNGSAVERLIIPGSVSAYGPEIPPLVKEDYPLGAHTLTYAIHKKATDEVIQLRAASLGACSTFLLRPPIFVGQSVENYLVGALRGTPTGNGKRGEKMRAAGKRLPMLLPTGEQYLAKQFQFVHIDDVARLMAYILTKRTVAPGLTIMNVAGRGAALTHADSARISGAKVTRLPGRFLCKQALKLLWNLGISGVPPDALPYVIGSYTMDTSRLQEFLSADYKQVIRFSVEDALAETFAASSKPMADAASS